ncbi:Flp family type IVb pilin [Arthrobacter sp. UC242_113]|uniref:Flp family type IVb pilin n=1 Tax=Arthrobacter sp. UC242_113 TaxID=3374550 RepID=UPI0037571986
MLAFFTNAAARVRRDEKGATAVEYGIMVALIAVVIIAAVTLLGGGMKDTFTQAQCSVTTGKTFTPAVAATGAPGAAGSVAAAAAKCE